MFSSENIELHTFESSGEANEDSFFTRIIKAEEYKTQLRASFYDTALTYHPGTFEQAMAEGEQHGAVIGLVAGGVTGAFVGSYAGPGAAIMAGTIAAIASAKAGGYLGKRIAIRTKFFTDCVNECGFLSGSRIGALELPFMHQLLDMTKEELQEIDKIYLKEMDPDRERREQNFKDLSAHFVTPLEYKDQLDMGIYTGATIGGLLGGLGGSQLMHKFSAAFAEFGSVFNGACAGGLYGFARNGIAGYIDGVIDGATIGYFHYHSQFSQDSKIESSKNTQHLYETPIDKIFADQTRESALVQLQKSLIVLEAFIEDCKEAIKKAYYTTFYGSVGFFQQQPVAQQNAQTDLGNDEQAENRLVV